MKNFYLKVIILLILQSHTVKLIAQQGLLIPSQGISSAKDKFQIEIDGWYQFRPNDVGALGAALTYCPYFPKSQSEFRIKAGVYSNSIGKNALSENNSLTSYLIIPYGPLVTASAGFTKLFPQKESKSYYELALNADFYYCYRQLSDSKGSFAINSYLLRTGVEIIPIPRKLSFYANLDLLTGVNGTNNYYDKGRPDLLEEAQYFDVGAKAIICPKRRVNIAPDFNFIFAEKRITDLLVSHEAVIPNFKLSLIIHL